MTEMELRLKVIERAKAWLGCRESDGTHRKIIDLYNLNRLPGTYAMSYDDPWCAAFVSAVGMACGLRDILLPHVNCDGMIASYRLDGRWREDDNFKAGIGDIIFYDWQDTGAGDNTGSADHVGIIVGVTDSTFTVIEGNISDAVGYRTVYRNQRFIRGFACPDYARAAGEEDSSTAAQSASTQNDTKTPNGGSVKLPMLMKGSRGEAVRAAQLLLIGRGFRCGNWGADADFGSATETAVRRFQYDRQLEQDGVIGPETWAKLLGINNL